VENKDVFVDLKKNGNGVYLKLSERNGKVKNTILIPASGIIRLKNILEEVAVVSAAHTRIRLGPPLVWLGEWYAFIRWVTMQSGAEDSQC
jgi:hypothetical protein